MVIQRLSDTSFLNSGFYHGSVSSGPMNISFGPFWIILKTHGDIRNFVFVAGVNDTGNKLLTRVNNIAGVVDAGNETFATILTDKLKVNIK